MSSFQVINFFLSPLNIIVVLWGFFLSVYIMLPNSWTTVLTSFWQIKYNPFMWPNLSQLSEFIPGALEINFRIGTSCLVHNTCIYFIEIESALHESKFKRNFPAVFINFKAGGQWKMFSFLNFECPKCFLVNNPLSFDYLELIYIFFLQNERQLLIMILFLRSSHQLATLKMLPTSYLEKGVRNLPNHQTKLFRIATFPLSLSIIYYRKLQQHKITLNFCLNQETEPRSFVMASIFK